MTPRPEGPPVVFVGPTLRPADAAGLLSGALVLPPARCGDVLAVLRLRPSAIVLIDGYYDTTPAPWHKEVLWALEAGVPVVGAASMGALRAAELDAFGMLGVGEVYASYRDGSRSADDAVAVLQTPTPGDERPVTDALVDIEAKSAALVGAGLLDAADARAVVSAARQQHFSERSLAAALAQAGQRRDERARLLAWLAGQAAGGSRKRADAEAALRLAAGGLPRPAPPEAVARTVHILRLAADATLRPLGRPDAGLPLAERILAADDTLARAAAVAGGLLRAADAAPAMDAVGHARSATSPGTPLAEAAEIVLTDLGDHPAAASSARRLRRLAETWTAPPRRHADLRPLLGELAGPATTPKLLDVLAAATHRGLAATETPWRRAPAEPSEDGLAWADALLPDRNGGADPLEAAGLLGRRRRAGQVLDVVRLGGALTGQLAAAIDPFDAPLLDGLAVLRATAGR